MRTNFKRSPGREIFVNKNAVTTIKFTVQGDQRDNNTFARLQNKARNFSHFKKDGIDIVQGRQLEQSTAQVISTGI